MTGPSQQNQAPQQAPEAKTHRWTTPAAAASAFVVLLAIALGVEGLTIKQIGVGWFSVTFDQPGPSASPAVAQVTTGLQPLPTPSPSPSPSPSPNANTLTSNQRSLLELVTGTQGLSLTADQCRGQASGQEQGAALSCTVSVDGGTVAVQVIQFQTTGGMDAWMDGQAGNVPLPIPSDSCWSKSGFVGYPSNSDGAEEACYQDQQGVFWVARTFPATSTGVLSSSGDSQQMTELRDWWDENPLIIGPQAG